MNGWWIAIVLLTPLAMLVALRAPGRWAAAVGAWAPLPALLLALSGGGTGVEAPWLLFGSRWELDGTGRVLLGFTALLWLAAGLFGTGYLAEDPKAKRFWIFWQLTLTGNLTLILAGEMVSFLTGFTLMSVASYGLIVHEGRDSDRTAGRVYLALAIAGEMVLFGAMVATARLAGGWPESMAAIREVLARPDGAWLAWLFVAGFGIKLGLLPVHFWLPLAHPAAPTPASAVLSGAMIKAGLLGMLRVLPFGEAALPELGHWLLGMGLVAALGAALAGLPQRHPKTILAYSSISQMGLVTVALGAGLCAPQAWPGLLAAILLMATHHALAKAALFLGVGVAGSEFHSAGQRRLIGWLLVIPGLALAGMPFTSGLAAKSGLKQAVAEAAVPGAVGTLLVVSGVTTTLLVGRYLVRVWPREGTGHHRATGAMLGGWLALIVAGLALGVVAGELSVKGIVKGLWPIAAGSMACWWVWRREPAWLSRVRVPAGDLALVAVVLAGWGLAAWRQVVAKPAERIRDLAAGVCRRATEQSAGSMDWLAPRVESWQQVGLALLVVMLVLFAMAS